MAATLVSPQEYLHTGFSPEREYLDGELVEKSMPTLSHGTVEANTAAYFYRRREEWNIRAVSNTRLMVTPTRYRVPDVTVLERPFTWGLAITDVPAIVFEILSPDDTVEKLMARCREYKALGVTNIVVLDPEVKCFYLFSAGSLILVESAEVTITLPKSGRQVSVSVEALFADLEQ